MSSSEDSETDEADQEGEEYNVDDYILVTSCDWTDIVWLRPSRPDRCGVVLQKEGSVIAHII